VAARFAHVHFAQDDIAKTKSKSKAPSLAHAPRWKWGTRRSVLDRKSRRRTASRRHRRTLCSSRRRLGQLLSAMRAIRRGGLNGVITFRARWSQQSAAARTDWELCLFDMPAAGARLRQRVAQNEVQDDGRPAMTFAVALATSGRAPVLLACTSYRPGGSRRKQNLPSLSESPRRSNAGVLVGGADDHTGHNGARWVECHSGCGAGGSCLAIEGARNQHSNREHERRATVLPPPVLM
jgi:hypothetical protein